MRTVYWRQSAIVVAVSAALLLTVGCARHAAFSIELPTQIDNAGKAIAVVGDLQMTPGLVRMLRRRENNADQQQQLMADLRSRLHELSALVIVGDLVFSGRSSRDWAHFDTLTAAFAEQIPVLPAIGNHDYVCFLVEICPRKVIPSEMLERFPWFEPGLPYSVESNDLLLLFLDSETGFPEQEIWLKERLADAAERYRAVLVFFHRPPFTNSIDRGAIGDSRVLEHFVPHFRDAAVPIVAVSGHVHGLEYLRREGVHYLTSAGGGGPRGAMAEERPIDEYAGPDCRRESDGALLRPYNYLLVRQDTVRLTIEIRGFCRQEQSRLLDTIEILL